MSDIAATAVAMKQAQTVQTAQMLMVKKQHEMEMSMISMLTEALENAPAPAPAGMGANVDKRA